MKATFIVKQEFEVEFLQAQCGVRYWEDATVNGQEDIKGDLIPCRHGDSWSPKIDLSTGIIINWKQGMTASIHYKICDDGHYKLLDKDDNIIKEIEGYVPAMMCPDGNGYGDYVIMRVDKDGLIQDWSPTLNGFEDEDYE